MQTILLINAIVAMLPTLIQAAEALFGTFKGQGAEKKETVLNGVKQGIDIAALTGNDAAANPVVKEAVVNLASNAIDAIVTTYNAIDAWGKTAPVLGPDV